ncbi:LLM class flavin-dependent oxidoreductase [Sphingobium boeckii]|uniref:Alkanesulfonate monooxygenase n=1 Tax=Sphingobium boeckii TaxID=1082345 RepID=A0A7W9EEP6_9SPHN|nr:LLM class flavin-dependent oxidoreductase [Sphingobium boeckii]MBB5686402.1 alkanesulfonate monooxygenase [Sphingobium boeckii]
MSIEILGVLVHRNVSEISAAEGPVFDREMVGELARRFDDNDFDRVLILQNSFAPDPFAIATYAAAITNKLAFMVAHRPGFIAPTMAARMFATLDHLSQGRAGVHIISAANDVETQCDGDFLTKEERYRRSREYVEVLRTMWGATEPVDFDGDFYKFNKSLAELRPVQESSIPIYWGGTSPIAIEKAGECADVYAIGGLQPLEKMRATVAELKASAAKAGRTMRLQTSARVIIGETEEEAWRTADHVLHRLHEMAIEQQELQKKGETASRPGLRLDPAMSTTRGGANRSQFSEIAAGRDLLDKRLWTGTTKASLDFATPTLPPALVGTAEQVADAMMDYYDMGITGFLMRGFDLLGDIELHGRELIPRLRRLAAERTGDRAMADVEG